MSPIHIIRDDEIIEVPFDDAAVYVRRIPLEKQKEFMSVATQTSGQQDPKAEGIDLIEYHLRVMEWGVRNWKGVTDLKTGEAVPCNPENVRRLPTHVQARVLRCIMQDEEEAEKEAEKN